MSTINDTTDGSGAFEGDRYERMRKAAEILAADPCCNSDENFVTGEMLLAFVDELCDLKILDDLTEHDAKTVALVANLDFLKGPYRQAERITEWLNDEKCGREDDNQWAVAAALTAALKITLDAYAGVDEQADR